MIKKCFIFLGYLYFTLPSLLLAIWGAGYAGLYAEFGVETSELPILTGFIVEWYPLSYTFIAFTGIIYLINKDKDGGKWLKSVFAVASVYILFGFTLFMR